MGLCEDSHSAHLVTWEVRESNVCDGDFFICYLLDSRVPTNLFIYYLGTSVECGGLYQTKYQ